MVPTRRHCCAIAPGFLWIILLLAVLLSADRIFQLDYDDGSLEIMAMGPVPLEIAALIKALAHWLTTSLPLGDRRALARHPDCAAAGGDPAA